MGGPDATCWASGIQHAPSLGDWELSTGKYPTHRHTLAHIHSCRNACHSFSRVTRGFNIHLGPAGLACICPELHARITLDQVFKNKLPYAGAKCYVNTKTACVSRNCCDHDLQTCLCMHMHMSMSM